MKLFKKIAKYTILLPFYVRKKKNDFNDKIEELNKKTEELNKKTEELNKKTEEFDKTIRVIYLEIQQQLFDICKSISNDKTNKLYFSSLLKFFDEKINAIQLVDILILKEIDLLCKKFGINYWLEGGTLLGAIRNNRIIPWDDDIDISMIRKDYQKLKKVLEENLEFNIMIKENYIRLEPCNNHVQYRVYLKNVPHCCFVDIFIYDYVNSKIFDKQSEYIRYRKEFGVEVNKITDYSKYKKHLIEALDNIDNEFNNHDSNKCLAWGIDNFIHSNFLKGADFHSYSDIFPLKTICFENNIYKCPNLSAKLINKYYIAPYNLPDDIFTHKHECCNYEELNIIKDYIKKQKLNKTSNIDQNE